MMEMLEMVAASPCVAYLNRLPLSDEKELVLDGDLATIEEKILC